MFSFSASPTLSEMYAAGRAFHDPGSARRHGYGIRVATQTLVMVVGCYLIANSLATVLQVWEFFDGDFLRRKHAYGYLIASDLAALVRVFESPLQILKKSM